MPISHLLEDFTVRPETEGQARLVSPDEWEDRRLAGFDEGYSAGWEDAVAAQAKDNALVQAALARRLEDLSFTYHEALSQMILMIEPVFRAMIYRVLPMVMTKTFAELIVEQVQKLAADRAASPLILTVPPGAAAVLRPVLDRDLGMPVNLREDANLQPDQAMIRLDEAECEIDGQHLLDHIAELVEGFVQQTKEEIRHG